MGGEPTDNPIDPDLELVLAAQNAPEGDLRAFEALVNLYRKRILADCQYLTHDKNNSEDLAQEVFVRAYFGLQRFEGRSSFRHWLQKIKVNHCLNHIKRRDGKESLSLDEESSGSMEQLRVPAAAHSDLLAKEDSRRVEETLASLPKTLRIPLVMCDMDELSYEEIAAALGIGLSAVKMRIKRAREQFKVLYRSEPAASGGGG